MANIQELYELVHALNKSEKKQVSTMVNAIGGKAKTRYNTDFLMICKQKTFDAKKLKSLLSKNNSGMSLSEANSNLYDFISKAILGFKTGIQSGYHNQLIFIEFLIERSLFHTADKQLNKLIPELEQKATFSLLLRAYELQLPIYLNIATKRTNIKLRTAMYEDWENGINSTLQNTKLLKANFHFFSFYREIGGYPRTKAQTEVYKKMLETDVLNIPMQAIHHRNLKIYFGLKCSLMSILKMKNTKTYIYECIEQLNKIAKKNALLLAEIDMYDILLATIMDSKQLELSEINIIKKRLLELGNNINLNYKKQQIHCKILLTELTYYLKSKQYDKGLHHFEIHHTENKKNTWIDAPMANVVYALAARFYFLNGKYAETIDCANYIHNLDTDERLNFKIGMTFLLLFTHTKLGNISVVESNIQSLRRQLNKMDKLYEPEKKILKFLNKADDPNFIQKNAVTLFNELIKLKDNPLHQAFFEDGDYFEWLKIKYV